MVPNHQSEVYYQIIYGNIVGMMAFPPTRNHLIALNYPLVNIQKAIENGPVEIVDLPIKNGDFPWLCQPVYQAGYLILGHTLHPLHPLLKSELAI